MKIIFFGTSEFAVPTLEACAGHVTLVVSQPDKPSGRGMKLHPSPVRQMATDLGISVETPIKARAPEFLAKLLEQDADLLLVAAYGQILSEAVLNSARRGGINLHGSILPAYRGAAPIQRCILNGESETGVTLMQMDKGMDTGDMIAFSKTKIGDDETYRELQERLSALAADLALEWLPRIYSGDYPRQVQDSEKSTHAAKISREDCRLNCLASIQEEYNRFRAVTPNPGAFLETKFGRLSISSARIIESVAEPGTWLRQGAVVFRDGGLELLEVQPEGKKRMSGKDFANGVRLAHGESVLPTIE